MVPLSLFATARRHWTWLRGAIERLCQFSREASLHKSKKNEGSCTPSWAVYSAHWPVTQMDACVWGGRTHPPPSPKGASDLQPCVMLAKCLLRIGLRGLWTLHQSAPGQVSMLLTSKHNDLSGHTASGRT